MATDGFWNVLSNDEIENIINSTKASGSIEFNLNPQKMLCERLIDEAYKNSRTSKLSRDNITLVVADLAKHSDIEKIHQQKADFFFNNEEL